MKTYTLTVVKRELNEAYKDEIKEYKSSSYGYTQNSNPPRLWNDVQSLSVEITEEQFEAIRKSSLEAF